jgi:hypothetical protein
VKAWAYSGKLETGRGVEGLMVILDALHTEEGAIPGSWLINNMLVNDVLSAAL